MKAKKAISLFLALVMAMSCMSMSAWATGSTFVATAASPTISTPDDLVSFAAAVNGGNTFKDKTVTLTGNIDLTGTWTPIGTGAIDDSYFLTDAHPFEGTFVGGGHTISGLTVNAGSNPAGLFGVVANGGSVSNLNVQVVSVAGTSFVGGVTGILYGGSVSGCKVTFANNGTISGTHFVGGVAGYAIRSASISSCTVIGGTITAADASGNDGDDVGGIVGYTWNQSPVTYCTVNGSTISAVRQGGGIVGLVNNTSVSNCTAIGVTIECNTNETASTGKASKIAFGGLVGAFCNGGCTLEDSTVNGATLTFAQGAVTNNVRMGVISGGVYVVGKEASHKYTVTNTTSTNCTLEIPDAAQLAKFRDAVNAGDSFYGNTVKLTQDITLDAGWTPIGNSKRIPAASVYGTDTQLDANPYFAGTFDGQNHTISGLSNSGYIPGNESLNDSKEYVYGLFGVVGNGAVLKNVNLTGVSIDTTLVEGKKGDAVGALVGYSFGDVTIEEVSVSGSVKGYDGVGAIVGRAYQGKFTTAKTISFSKCSSNATVSGTNQDGSKISGLFGFVNSNSGGTFPVNVIVRENSFTGTVGNGTYTSPIAVFGSEMFNFTNNIADNTVYNRSTKLEGTGMKWLVADELTEDTTAETVAATLGGKIAIAISGTTISDEDVTAPAGVNVEVDNTGAILVSPKDIGATLTVQGQEFSVLDYLRAVKDANAENTNAYKLADAALNYGNAAAQYFNASSKSAFTNEETTALNNKIDDLVVDNTLLTSLGDAAPLANSTLLNSIGGLTYLGASMVLETTTTLRLNFMVSDPYAADNYCFKVNGGQVLHLVQRSGEYYYLTVGTDIAPNQYNNLYAVTYSTDGDNYYAYGTFTVNGYISRVLQGEQTVAANRPAGSAVNLAKALYLYWAATKGSD